MPASCCSHHNLIQGAKRAGCAPSESISLGGVAPKTSQDVLEVLGRAWERSSIPQTGIPQRNPGPRKLSCPACPPPRAATHPVCMSPSLLLPSRLCPALPARVVKPQHSPSCRNIHAAHREGLSFAWLGRHESGYAATAGRTPIYILRNGGTCARGDLISCLSVLRGAGVSSILGDGKNVETTAAVVKQGTGSLSNRKSRRSGAGRVCVW